jgi:hypothetical protein
MLVKFSCDCVGYRLTDAGGAVRCWVIQPCDGDGRNDDSPNIWERKSLDDKDWEPLSVEHTVGVLKVLSDFVSKGHRFDTIQFALQPRTVG